MIVISSSSTTTARTCWKKYYWRYEEHLQPVTKPIQLSQGRIIHEAFDKFYKGVPEKEVTQYIIDTYNLELSKAEYVDQEQLETAKYTALGMWLGYPHQKRLQYSVVGSERDFSVPIGHGLRLCGKIDRTLEKQGTLWVGEMKTSGDYEANFTRRAENSYQATAYVYAMRKLGYNVQGVIYDVIKKPSLRKGRSETASQFCRRIAYDYKQRPDYYYFNYSTYRSPDQLRWFEGDIRNLIKELKRHKKYRDWYRNPDACYAYNHQCEYHKICFSDKPDPLLLQLYFTRGKDDKDLSGMQKDSKSNKISPKQPYTKGGEKNESNTESSAS